MVDFFFGVFVLVLYVEVFVDKWFYFIIFWLGKYLIGIMDYCYDGFFDRVKVSDDEIDYLIVEINWVMLVV